MRWARSLLLVGASAAMFFTTGCGSATAPSAASGDPGVDSDPGASIAGVDPAPSGDAAPIVAVVDQRDPKQVVIDFLAAIKRGDTAAAESSLTPLALEATKKHDLVVAPPGSPTAQFAVGSVEYVKVPVLQEAPEGQPAPPPVETTVAHVESTWTDRAEDGVEESSNIVWVLTRQEVGWRVAGMATTIPGQELPLLLDFEKPEEMIELQRQAEALVRQYFLDLEKQNSGQNPAGARAAQNPAGSSAVPR
jgi:hypothetical protein